MRIGIWTTGCNRNCRGCTNPDLQVFDPTKDIAVSELMESIKSLGFEGITISGGEPFLQPKGLREIVETAVSWGIEDILVFTGYRERELREMENPDVDAILSNIAVLVDGPFEENFYVDDPLRGSANQNVIILKDRYRETYDRYREGKKRIDIIDVGDETHFIGIPSPGYDELYRSYLECRRK